MPADPGRTAQPIFPIIEVRTPQLLQRTAAPGMWLPATALAMSMVLAAAAGLVLGILAALPGAVTADRWLPVVQAHAVIQLWGWFATSIVALVFEFIVRLNRRPPFAVAPRIAALLCLAVGAVVFATGAVIGRAEVATGVAGAVLLGAGSLQFLILVVRVAPGRPLGLDLHPLFFRAGAAWLVVAALLVVVGAPGMAAGVVAPRIFDSASEVFLRGFTMNVVVAVALRAFPGHLGVPPVASRDQRVLWALLNTAALSRLAALLPAGDQVEGMLLLAADLGFVATIAWATRAFDLGHAVRAWGRGSERHQVMVPIAWAGLLVYGLGLTGHVGLALAGQPIPTLLAGGVRHAFMAGFVAPLLLAMTHVVLERFGTGRVIGVNWLTAAFVLSVLAWPLRVLPPMVDPATGPAGRWSMGIAGMLLSLGLLLGAGVAARNALEARRFARRFAGAGTGSGRGGA